jgi:hypothetical protein
MPAAVTADNCNQYSASNATCLTSGGCNCAFLTCDGVTACVAANTTSGVPLNLNTCKQFSFCYACTSGFSSWTFCGSGETYQGLAGWQIALIVLGVLLLVAAIVGFIVFRRRRASFTSV